MGGFLHVSALPLTNRTADRYRFTPNKAKHGTNEKMDSRIEELEHLASQFRTAILKIPAGDLPEGLKHFPCGACSDASYLLLAWLKDKGYEGVQLVSGGSPNHESGSHAWLNVKGVIVDITADQFPDGISVPYATCDPSWHAKFENQETCTIDFRHNDAIGFDGLQDAFDLIQGHLDAQG